MNEQVLMEKSNLAYKVAMRIGFHQTETYAICLWQLLEEERRRRK